MASRKRVKFEGIPEDDSGDEAATAPLTKKARRFKEKHSLDSDEEDKEDDVGTSLGDEDLAHQEAATIDWDGDTRVTPFNLSEEMKEGRFDAAGNYFHGGREDDEEIADQWLDTVDWDRVRETEGVEPSSKETGEEEDDDDDDDDDDDEDLSSDERKKLSSIEKNELLRKAVDLLQPGETVAGALRRLGGGARPGARRQTGKGKKVNEKDSEDKEEIAKKKKLMLELTEVADKLLQQGQMTIYSDTYEKLKFELLGEKAAVAGSDQGSSVTEAESVSASSGQQSDAGTSTVNPDECDEVCWVYKWTDSEEADIHGPFTSTQMNEWTESGFFPDGVFVRKAKDKSGAFYTSKRIDFDLYID